MLLALTIISTVAAVSSALSALGLPPQRQRPQPQTIMIVMTSIEVPIVDPRMDRSDEGGPELESVA